MMNECYGAGSGSDQPAAQPEQAVRRRGRRLLVTGLTAAAVAGGSLAGMAITGDRGEAATVGGAPAAPAPAVAAAAPAAAGKVVASSNGYRFQNKPQAVGTLPKDGRVRIAAHLWFQTRGTKWAITSHQPGESSYEPFGWRATVGNSNLGDARQPSLQSLGRPTGLVVSSVFRSDKVVTVVYTSGKKAWYGKVYKLAGIPGWVESSAELKGQRFAGDPLEQPPTAVFGYDRSGRLLTQFPAGVRNPLPPK